MSLFWAKPHGPWTSKYKDAGGVWRNKKVPVDIVDEAEAEKWFVSWLTNSDTTTPAPAPRLTVQQVAERWVKWLKDKPGAPASAHEAGERVTRLWLTPFQFSHIKVDELQLHDCVSWIEDVQRMGKAPYTVRNIVQQVRTLFSDARGKGWYARENFFNDAYVKSRLRGAAPVIGKDTIVVLDLTEVRKIVSYVGDGVPLRRHAKYVLAVTSGLRAGELAGLQVKDVDLAGAIPIIKVERQLVPRESAPGKPVFKEPKKGSKRIVPLHPHVLPLIKAWKSGLQNAGPESPFFPSSEGEFIADSHATWLRADLGVYGISPLFEGVHPITFHALRRTCLTLLTNAEVPEGDVKAIAGHSAAGVTRKHYVAKNLERIASGIAKVPLAEGEERDDYAHVQGHGRVLAFRQQAG